MGNNPDLKFPLRAEDDAIIDANEKRICWIDAPSMFPFDECDLAAELIRLANLAHEAEAVLNLALEGMFHAEEQTK